MNKLENVLEKIKQQGNYAVNLFYGEDIGCDDLDVEQEERNIRIVMTPVGYVGELRKLWKGKLKDLYDFDFSQNAKVVNNPPSRKEISNDGYYIWGTEKMIEKYKD